MTSSQRTWRAAAGLAVVLAALSSILATPVDASGTLNAERTPVVLFPAFHFTKLLVSVHNQSIAPDCPRSGSFTDWFQNDQPSSTFSQVCRDKLLTLRYDPDPRVPMPDRFSNQIGVTATILDYGTTQSAPFYESMYQALVASGYVRNRDVRVAGYDARLTPDIGDFFGRTKRLIEETYRENGHRPVHLVGHSNGPLYAEYLLTHVSQAWKAKYIHGFTPIAGNFPGQGVVYPIIFTGLNIEDFSFPATKENALSSARMYLSAPSTYMSAADPRVFQDQEVVVQDASTGRTYTPKNYAQLFDDAGLAQAKEIANYYIGFLKMSTPASFPHVDVYAEKGSGIPTVVGASLRNLSVGQVIDPNTTQFFIRDGDVNQEDITNNAVLAWQAMPCFRFSLIDNPGIDHFSLPSNADLLARLVRDAALPRSDCG